LHVAAEYGNVAAVALLLDRGADVNARATVDEAGIGGQTAIFHAVTQFGDDGLPVTQLLLERGADLRLRVKLPGAYERPGEIVECTPLGYALLFRGESQDRTVALLREGALWSSVTRSRERPLGGEHTMKRVRIWLPLVWRRGANPLAFAAPAGGRA
jgi:ankyrin repeat protein